MELELHRAVIVGSTNDSVLDLVFGYDGLGRIFGGSAGNGGGADFSGSSVTLYDLSGAVTG